MKVESAQTRSSSSSEPPAAPSVAQYSHELGSVSVDECAESQAVPERRGHVGDGHVPVALAPEPAPLLQRLDGRHPPGAPSRTRAAAGAEWERCCAAGLRASGRLCPTPPPAAASQSFHSRKVRECVSVCVSQCVCESVCLCVSVCVWERLRVSVCVCVESPTESGKKWDVTPVKGRWWRCMGGVQPSLFC